jgi:hypothetical protein
MNESKSLFDFSKVASEVAPINNIFASHGGTGGASSTNNAAAIKKGNVSDLKNLEQSAKNTTNNATNASVCSKRSVKQGSKHTKK